MKFRAKILLRHEPSQAVYALTFDREGSGVERPEGSAEDERSASASEGPTAGGSWR